MSEHLPIPWDLAWEDGKHGVIAADVDGEWKVVALVGNMTPDDGKNDIRKANAEFIVRACNAHDVLVAAVEAAYEHINNTTPDSTLRPTYSVLTTLRTALEKTRPVE